MSNLHVTAYQPANLVSEIDAIGAVQPHGREHTPWRPLHETFRTRQGMTYSFDLPGVLPTNLHVECREGRLWVWGGRTVIAGASILEKSSNRPAGSFAVDLPIVDWVDPSRIFQEFKDGVLTVFLPKRRESIKKPA